MSALFIGAGLDLKIISLLKNITEFTFVDVKPQNLKGLDYDSLFINQLKEQMERMGYSVSSEKVFNDAKLLKKPGILSCFSSPKYFKPGLIVFKNGSKTVFYFYSVCFPYVVLKDLDDRIKECDTLICAHHDPHNSILKLMKLPITFVGILELSKYKSHIELVRSNISTFNTISENSHIVHNYIFYKLKKIEQNWDRINSEFRRKLKFVEK